MMNFQELGRLFRQHLIWFILFPCLGAGAIYFFMRNESRQYKTKATLYTGFTSGYSLRAAEENFHVDYSGISNAFDNVLTTLNSTQTLYQVGINLLTEHLYLTKPAERQLSAASFQRLQQAIPASLRQSLIASGSPEITHQLLDSLAQSQTDNPVQKLLIRSGSDYTADVIGKRLKSSRRGASDMLDLEYDAEDPAIAQQTLSLAIAELNSRYSLLKRSETSPVVAYYEDNAKAAKKRLGQAEAKLRSFNVAHNVLNFEDEMKNRSLTRDALVAEYNEEMMRNRATKAAMDALGQRMNQGGTLLKINTQLTDKQAELMAAESQLINARANGKSQAVLDKVQARVDQLAAELKVIAQSYFAADNSSESIPRLNLISSWLDKLLGVRRVLGPADGPEKTHGRLPGRNIYVYPAGIGTAAVDSGYGRGREGIHGAGSVAESGQHPPAGYFHRRYAVGAGPARLSAGGSARQTLAVYGPGRGCRVGSCPVAGCLPRPGRQTNQFARTGGATYWLTHLHCVSNG